VLIPFIHFIITDERPYDPFAGEHILDSERDTTATTATASDGSNSEDSNTDDVPAGTGPVVYVSGEESTGQIAARAQRLELKVRLKFKRSTSFDTTVLCIACRG
jgi:hypothetical protein